MLDPGPARKVTIHLNEDTSARQDFLHNEIVAFLMAKGVSGANRIKPYAGFGFHRRIHEPAGDSEAHMPVRIEFVESAALVDAIMPELCDLLTDGLIEAHDTYVYKAAHERGREV